MFSQSLVIYALIACTSAFHPCIKRRASSSLSLFSLEKLPSFFPAGDPSKNVEKAVALKNNIRSLSKGTSNGITASESTRSQINDLVKQLESINPTRKLSSSPKLDGSWKLVYTSNEGSSAGKLGPFVGEVEQLIQLEEKDDPIYINYVRLGGGAVEGALTASWDVLSNDKWQVNFEKIRFKILGIKLVEKDLNATGVWRKTYLDDDFRILYAAGGKNTVKENIYILSTQQ